MSLLHLLVVYDSICQLVGHANVELAKIPLCIFILPLCQGGPENSAFLYGSGSLLPCSKALLVLDDI